MNGRSVTKSAENKEKRRKRELKRSPARQEGELAATSDGETKTNCLSLNNNKILTSPQRSEVGEAVRKRHRVNSQSHHETQEPYPHSDRLENEALEMAKRESLLEAADRNMHHTHQMRLYDDDLALCEHVETLQHLVNTEQCRRAKRELVHQNYEPISQLCQRVLEGLFGRTTASDVIARFREAMEPAVVSPETAVMVSVLWHIHEKEKFFVADIARSSGQSERCVRGQILDPLRFEGPRASFLRSTVQPWLRRWSGGGRRK
jgi:hypothetical protein